MQRVRQALTEIEQLAGKTFGSPERPLLLSVRSGGAISMPGMMATIHNVGLNEELIAELIANHGNGYLAWDNYRRFLQSWGFNDLMAPAVAFRVLLSSFSGALPFAASSWLWRVISSLFSTKSAFVI